MAFRSDTFCEKHKKITLHINGECSVCREEMMEKEIKEWEAMSLEKKLQDLYLRIRRLEKGPPRF